MLYSRACFRLGLLSPIVLGLLATMLVSNDAAAQEPPKPNDAPVDISDFEGDDAAKSNDPNKPQALGFRISGPVGGYHSTMLGASLNLQYMQITQSGRKVNFWGGRIVSLEKNSPLNKIGLQLGDVVTRLDSIPIANKASQRKRNQPYRLPEADSHYGPTKVRYIFRSTQNVQEKTVDLGNLRRNPPPPRNTPVPIAP